MAETEEVDFDEQVDLGDGGATMETEAAASSTGKAKTSDAAGRRRPAAPEPGGDAL